MNQSNNNTTEKVRIVEITANNDGQRIDNYLSSALKGVPKTHIYRIVRTGQVRVNKGRIKPNYRLKIGDMVRIPPVRIASGPDSLISIPRPVLQKLRQSVLYEDNDYLVLNKPSGLAVHAGSGIKFGVIESIGELRPELGFIELVHRLDRETSGCLLLAKNRNALTAMHDLLREGNVEKRYLALLKGRWENGERTVTAPLIKNVLQGGERMILVSDQGKQAVSHYKLITNFVNCCMVEVNLETGRTHQIRVHSAHIGHPIAGDKKYGDDEFNSIMKNMGLKRLFLHAHVLAFQNPVRDHDIHVSAPLSEDLQTVLDNLNDD
jgi:23S rRNA pseudouridine955/2504/2580 synthase